MKNFKHNLELRQKLQIITDNYNEGCRLTQQIKLIEGLSKKYRHSIELIEEARKDRPWTWYYNNCYAYAFDLFNSSEYKKLANMQYNGKSGKEIFARSEFVVFLINNKILEEIAWGNEKNGDIIVYFDNTKPTHAGKINSGKVISKWGPRGHVWRHDIYEIPLSYGNEHKIFSGISSKRCINAFIEYAKSEGMQIKLKDNKLQRQNA